MHQGLEGAWHAQPDQADADAVESRGSHLSAHLLARSQAAGHGVIECERPAHDIGQAPGRGRRRDFRGSGRHDLAVPRIDPALVLALQHGMDGDQHPVFEDADLLGMVLHLDHAFARRVRDAVKVPADLDHTLVADAALDRQHGAVGDGGQRGQVWLLLGEMLVDDPLRSRMATRIGDARAAVLEMGVEVVHVPEAAGEEEVLADIALRTLHLALRLGPIRAAGTGQRAAMRQQRHQRGVVGDHALGVLVDHRRLHPVVEQLRRRPAHRGEGIDATAHNRLQILRGTEPPPQPAAVAEHHGEEPDDARHAGLVGESHPELREVDLCLPPGRGFEPSREDHGSGRTNRAQVIGDGSVAAAISHPADLA